jgi:hypothetical protein
MEVEEENSILVTKNENFSVQIATLENKEKELDERLSSLVKEKNNLTQKLAVSETEKNTALSKLTDIEDKLSKSKNELADYKVKTAEIVNDFKEQNKMLLAKIEELKQNVPTQSSTISSGFVNESSATNVNTSSSENVELPKVIVNPAEVKTGKVVVVNKKFNFFICSLGQQDGINLNDEVAVYRNNVMIATAVVEKVYDNLSANGILKVKKDFSIQEGDIVKVKSA